MNKKGFTLVELLATIVILSLVVGIAIFALTSSFKSAKNKTELIFIKNLEDAIDIYLDSTEVKGLSFNTSSSICKINKRFGESKIYKATVIKKFQNIMESEDNPLTTKEFRNPVDKDKTCNTEAEVSIYRDDEYIYYYLFNKDDIKCLIPEEGQTTATGYISNLPCECLETVEELKYNLPDRCQSASTTGGE